MKAIIKVDVPEFQIGQEVTVYFRDTMCTKGMCEKAKDGIITTDKAIRIIRKYLGYSDGTPYDTVDAIIEDIMDETDREADE